MSCPRVPGRPQTAAAPGAAEGPGARVGLLPRPAPWPAAPVVPSAPGGLLLPGVGLGCGAASQVLCSLPVCTSPFPCRPLAVPGREQPALSHVDWLS